MDIASLSKKFGIGKELGLKEIAAGVTAIEVEPRWQPHRFA